MRSECVAIDKVAIQLDTESQVLLADKLMAMESSADL
jgi:hypothetical protein